MAKDFKSVALSALVKLRDFEIRDSSVIATTYILLKPTFDEGMAIAESIKEKIKDNGFKYDDVSASRIFSFAFALMLVEEEIGHDKCGLIMNRTMNIDSDDPDVGTYAIHWLTTRGDKLKVWDKYLEKASMANEVVVSYGTEDCLKSLRRYNMRVAYLRKNSEKSGF